MTDTASKTSSCPVCGGVVDRLRAPAVSIVDGSMIYFCSAACRRKFRSGSGGTDTGKDLQAQEEKNSDTTPQDSGTDSDPGPEKENDAKPDDIATRPKYDLNNSVSLKKLRLYSAGCLIITGAAVLLQAVLSPVDTVLDVLVCMMPSAVLVVAALYPVIRRDRRHLIRMLEEASIPVAVIAYMTGSLLNVESYNTAVYWRGINACILASLVYVTGWIEAELLNRSRLSVSPSSDFSKLQDRQEHSETGRIVGRVASIITAAGYPAVIFAVAIMSIWVGYGALDILAASIIIISPRLLRKSVEYVLEAAVRSLMARGVIVTDNAAIEKMGRTGRVIFLPHDVIMHDSGAVRFEILRDDVNRQKLTSRLALAGKCTDTEWSCRLAGLQNDSIDPSGEGFIKTTKEKQGEGFSVEDESGILIIGTPLFMLDNGISPVPADDVRREWEDQGMEVIIVSDEASVAAVLGFDVETHAASSDISEQLDLRGYESIYLGREQASVAHCRAKKAGMEHVRPAVCGTKTEKTLKELSESGIDTVLVARGSSAAAFRPHVQTAIGLGDAGDTGGLPVHIPVQDPGLVLPALAVSREAVHLVFFNIMFVGFICGLGGMSAFLGDLNPVQAGIIALFASIIPKAAIFAFVRLPGTGRGWRKRLLPFLK